MILFEKSLEARFLQVDQERTWRSQASFWAVGGRGVHLYSNRQKSTKAKRRAACGQGRSRAKALQVIEQAKGVEVARCWLDGLMAKGKEMGDPR